MLFVNSKFFAVDDLERIRRHVAGMIPHQQMMHRITSICLKDPLEIMSVLRQVISCQGSVLLINGEMPRGQALKLAQEAGSTALLYGSMSEPVQFLSDSTVIDTPSLLQFSSGTTGTPKIIRRSWQQVEREIANYNARLSSNSSEVPIILVPVSHSFGLITGVLAALERKAQPVIVTDKNPKFAAHVIQSTGESIVYGVPYLFHILLSVMRNERAFHKIISSGAPFTGKVFDTVKARSELVIQQYGCSELGCISLGFDPATHADVGAPLQHLEVTVDGQAESPDEIIVTMDGSPVFTRDLGWINPAGRIQVEGRIDDLINVSGQKVIPYEVEQVLLGMEEIQEVVVYRTKHKVWGEAVKAMIVGSNRLAPESAKKWCMERLPQYKIPSAFDIVEEIPRAASGKISRKWLSENY